MRILKFMLITVFAMTLTNCGDDKKKEEKEEIKLKSSAPKAVKADPNVTEVVLLATDLMKFNKEEIRVPAGKTVKLVLRHTGKLGVEVMGHNFVLLKPGTEIPVFASKATTAKENGYIPEDGKQVIAHTKMLGGGQSDTIEFEAPEPGTYDFICSFSGHSALMKGKFIVE